MPRVWALALTLCATLLMLMASDAESMLFAWQAERLAGILPGGEASLHAVSWGGWLATVLVVRKRRTRFTTLLFMLHPATALLAAGGFGLAVLSVTLFFAALERLNQHKRASDVPALGLAMMLLALTLPTFELMILAVASPLFLIAPAGMLRQHMAGFYLVVLLPALVALAWLDRGAGGDAASLAPDLTLAGPAALAIPGAALAFAARRAWRLVVITAVIAAGAAALPSVSPLYLVGLGGYAAAIVIRRRVSLALEVCLVIATALAATALAGHIG